MGSRVSSCWSRPRSSSWRRRNGCRGGRSPSTLAGRVDDDALRGFRGYLGRNAVPLTAAEHDLLTSVAVADPSELAEIPRTNKVFLAYEFDAGTDTPEPRETDERLVRWVSSAPAARRLSRVHRRPVDAMAAGQATWLYLLELAPEGELAATRNQVPIGDSTHGVIEVYTTGETLPQYHVEALRAACAVWSRRT